MNPRESALARAFPEPVSGPSYRAPTRVLAVVLVAGLFAWGGLTALRHAADFGPAHWAAVAAVAAVLLWPLPGILFGRTVVDARGVRQLGWPAREVAWAEVHRARFVPVPGAPRLVLAAGFGRMKVFQSGDAVLDDAFGRAAALIAAMPDATAGVAGAGPR